MQLRHLICAAAMVLAPLSPAFAQAPQSEAELLAPADDALVGALGDFANGCQTSLTRYLNHPVPEGMPQTCQDAPLNLAELRYIVELGRMNGMLRGCGSDDWRTHFGALDLKLAARPDTTPALRNYGAFLHGIAQGMARNDDAPRVCGAPPTEEGRRRVEEWAVSHFTNYVAPLAWPTSREDYLRAGAPPEMLDGPVAPTQH